MRVNFPVKCPAVFRLLCFTVRCGSRMGLSALTARLALVLVSSVRFGAFGLQDVTGDLFGSENAGTVAAFGDFNSDKQTDVFVIRAGE